MTTPNLCLFALASMIALLFLLPKQMMTITACTALVMVVICGGKVVEGAAAHLLAVLLVMSATQLAVRRVLEAGAGASLSAELASIASHRFFRRTPAALLIPVLFVPATWVLAAVLHNVTAIAIVVPLLSRISKRFGVDPCTTLCALLVASNLGGASLAFGDGPAIMQREVWGFNPAVFAAAMVPRNALLVATLTLLTAAWTWWPLRNQTPDWADVYRRLKVRDEIGRDAHHKRAVNPWPAIYAGLVLLAFISLQFVFPTKGPQIAACALLALILATSEEERGDALMVLGLEPVVVIASLFTISSAVQNTSLFGSFASIVNEAGIGRIESVSYLMAFTISADGAAAALVHSIHDGSQGSLMSAWQLAGGICAGSSAMLTSASAGPILYALAKLYGNEISFRRYAVFGVPVSLAMLIVSIIYNALAGGAQ